MSINAILPLLFLFCVSFTFVSTTKSVVQTKEKSGPYVSVVKRLEKCQKPTKPYPKDPIGMISIEMKNNLVKGNVTVLRKNSNLQISVQEFYYEDGHWRLTLSANKFTCRHKWLAVLLDLVRIKYDKKNCGVPKNSYLFEVDNNVIDHVWLSTREYGRVLRRVEVNTKEETVLCFELECDINPIN